MIHQPRLTRLLVARRTFRADPVFIVDVGASGGIDTHWYEFGDQLQAVGFDPLTAEVTRLNDHAVTGLQYVAAWVTSPAVREIDDVPSTQFFPRTSAVRAAEIASLDYARTYYNAGAEIVFTDDRIVLDEFFDESDAMGIDFMKVDTDGHDYDVLVGSDHILSSGRVLGLAVEAQFQGPVSETANLFGNIDAFLRRKGFSLFDLEIYRYSRAALPARFVHEIPAQTVTGQVSWGEAIYFRDLGDPRYEEMCGFEPTAEDVLKLACLYEIFGMPDCSAELILKYREQIGSFGDPTELLDLLAREQSGRDITHAGLLQEFSADVRDRFRPGQPLGQRTQPTPEAIETD